MALEQKLQLRLAQKLVMTPSLQQAIKLLQMTRMELQGVLTQELVENPLLEETDETFENEADETEASEEETAEAEAKKKSYIDKFIPHIGIALKDILGFSDREEKKVVERLRRTLERSREHMA